MSDEVQLISDGDGLAVIGETSAVERFLTSEGLKSRELRLDRLRPILNTAAVGANAASGIAEHSGRWVQLTQQSTELAQKYALVHKSASGLSTGVVRAPNGQFAGLLEFAKAPGTVGALLTNPAALAGAAGIMSQIAMQMAMDEIRDYLAIIDEKIDDILRAQKDAVLADMIGVDFVIEEAMAIRRQVGRVSDVTWSKVQGTSMTIARTQAYALRQLDALASKLERQTNMGEIAESAKEIELKVQEWLVILAQSVQLQDALAILELDRVLDIPGEDVDQHRLGLRSARQRRLDLISQTTQSLMARMSAAAGTANKRVLLHPTSSKSVVRSSNYVAIAVDDFHEGVGIAGSRDAVEARRWLEAVSDVKDDALEAGSEGLVAARRFGAEAFNRARSVTDDASIRFAERALRRRDEDEKEEAPTD